MSMPTPNAPDDGKKRMSPVVKLALVGVGSAALLYSCAPAVGGLTALPFIMGMGNPFYRPPIATNCPPGVPNCTPQGLTGSTGTGTTSSSSGSSAFYGSTGSSGTSITSPGSTSSGPSAGTTTSQRGGFGSTASSHGSGGSS